MLKILKFIDTAIDKASIYTLVVSVFVMLFFSVLSIVLRWFGQSLEFIEPMVRHLVFLSAFLGGVLATGRGTHIGIDVIVKYLEAMKQYFLCIQCRRLIYLACVGTLCWLTWSSMLFVKVEMEFGKAVFFGISSGHLVKIIPFGFSLIAYRYFYLFITTFTESNNSAQQGGHV